MKTVERTGIKLEKIIVFGSRAREDHRDSSDVDILIVSEDFEGTAWNRRPRELYRDWDYSQLPSPEFVCLTPEEFDEKRKQKPHIVRDAVEEGVQLA